MLIHDTVPDADGWVSATVVNRGFRDGRGLALQIRYRKDQLPFLVQWRNFRERGYVMGVEPPTPTSAAAPSTVGAAPSPSWPPATAASTTSKSKSPTTRPAWPGW